MNKMNLLIVFTIIFCSNIFAQNIESNSAKLSALTQQYLISNSKAKADLQNTNYIYCKIKDKKYISAFIKVSSTIKISEINSLGVIIGTKAGNIWTVKIPVNKVADFVAIKGLEYVQLDEPIHPTLNVARTTTRVDSVHRGLLLPQEFTGKDVVVGILDVGFDYTHPTFYDTLGNKYRVKRIWEQKTDGTPPVSYNYGHEIIDTLQMLAQETDNIYASHGTHVAGMAAGSGFGSLTNDKFRGMAYESDLVFVGITPPKDQWTSAGMTDIIDGMNYIYEYAASQGKPAVANLSWGCSIGPNDGSSLFAQACDNLTGEGKIFTISAGNNGTEKIHLQKTFAGTDTLIQSFITFSSYLAEKKSWLDIWGEVGETFCVQLRLYNNTVEANGTEFICLSNTTIDTFLVGTDNDTCFFKLSVIQSDYNNKPHALFDFNCKTANKPCIAVKSASGRVNLWLGYVSETAGYYGAFGNNGQGWASVGNSELTLGEMASTRSAITVGAYASKVSFVNLSSQNLSYSSYVLANKIVPFSSHGPTADDRTKPDITAPGLTIASSVNSFDVSYASGGSNYSNSVYKYTNPTTSRDYYFAEMSGTSMSSPAAAGIVALMLESKPNLTPQEIKDILTTTAIKDIYTSATPNGNLWGAGKINAYGAVKATLPSNIFEQKNTTEIKLYPNPASTILNIDLDGQKTIVISNIIGNTCKRISTNQNKISIEDLKSGIYFVSVLSSDNKVVTTKKIVKL